MGGNLIVILYLIPITVALLTVTIVDWDSQCNRPLKHWTISQIIIQVLLTLNHAVILYKLPSSADTAEVVNERYEPFHYNIHNNCNTSYNKLALAEAFNNILIGSERWHHIIY